MSLNTIEDERVNSFVMAMIVKRNEKGRFRTYHTTFVSDKVRLEIQQSVMEITLAERITFLVKNDTAGTHDAQSRFLY